MPSEGENVVRGLRMDVTVQVLNKGADRREVKWLIQIRPSSVMHFVYAAILSWLYLTM